jgi:AcrR family transcriptional regulator
VTSSARGTRKAGAGPDNARSRELLLDAAEALMSEKGYAATPVSAICLRAGVAPTSLYWHFGSKEGLLATVMERGAERWFAALPRWAELDGAAEGAAEGGAGDRAGAMLRAGADAVAGHPVFLRLAYTLALHGGEDDVVTGMVRRVRRHAMDYFRAAIPAMLSAEHGPGIPPEAVEELVRFAVAYSDGCFFAAQLEPEVTDLRRMYADLGICLRALAPAVIARVAGGA